jgi:peptidoglycan/xylan/chitin deacetylase (PgdA/CDA1 family)
LFDELQVRASFFVACGPDHSGRAIRRIFRPGFFEKMRRTNAVGTYGWRTLLYGTLLPGPHVARSCAGTLKEIVACGHELALHGYDHVFWQDALPRLDGVAVQQEVERGRDAFAQATGMMPQAFGAPGWQCTAASFAAEDLLDLRYHSDTRGVHPYRPRMGGETFRTLEIPTTLPTLDETYGRVGRTDRELIDWYVQRLHPQLNVYTAHAEMEGRQQLGWMRDWLRALVPRARIVRLIEIAADHTDAPVAEVAPGPIAGRAGTVAWQQPSAEAPHE